MHQSTAASNANTETGRRIANGTEFYHYTDEVPEPVFGEIAHPIREEIHLIERCVHVRSNPESIEFRMDQRRRHDVMLGEEPSLQLPDVHPIHSDDTDRAALLRPDRRQHLHPVARRQQTLRPAIAQRPQARDLPLGADRPVERQRDGDGVVIRRRMRSDLLVLTNVVRLLGRRGHQRPQRRNLVAAHI